MQRIMVCICLAFAIGISPSHAAERFEFVSENSSVEFFAKSTLHDFSGKTDAISGGIETSYGHFDDGSTMTIKIFSKTLKTGNQKRDKGMYEKLRIALYPAIQFSLEAIDSYAPKSHNDTYVLDTRGSLSIAGTTLAIPLQVVLTGDPATRIRMRGNARLKLTDFNIKPPSFMGFIKVDNNIEIVFDVYAVRVRDTETTKPEGTK